MWFFMNTCYGLSFLTFILLITGFAQSFLHFPVFKAGPLTFMILTSIIYLFTETLVIFFFVGTGVSIKEYTQTHKLDPTYHKRSLGIKFRVYPPLLLNLLLMVIVFVLVGAVDTYRVPAILYQALFLIALLHFLKVKIVQHGCFRDNTRIVLDMAAIGSPTGGIK